jgi:trans-aconitate 3-methyltransferase
MYLRQISQSSESVWRLQGVEAAYWNDYIATRPTYDATIFNPIFTYHEANGKRFHDALDIGTGAGSALDLMTKRFTRVTASDNDAVSLGFAQKRYSHIPPSQLCWTVSKAEELITHHAPSSFDMITCALTFPLLDTEKALQCISRLLRPVGTLAIWFYGPPIFVDPIQAAKSQPILYAALDHAFRPVVSGGSAQARGDWKRAADGMASWLDYIPFSTEQWTNVRRQKWNNSSARLSFFGPNACDFPIEPNSAVGTTETVIERQDLTFWKRDWDVEMLKRFVLAIFPKPDHKKSADKVMEGYFQELEQTMGGNNTKVTVSWPVVLVLAQKFK